MVEVTELSLCSIAGSDSKPIDDDGADELFEIEGVFKAYLVASTSDDIPPKVYNEMFQSCITQHPIDDIEDMPFTHSTKFEMDAIVELYCMVTQLDMLIPPGLCESFRFCDARVVAIIPMRLERRTNRWIKRTIRQLRKL